MATYAKYLPGRFESCSLEDFIEVGDGWVSSRSRFRWNSGYEEASAGLRDRPTTSAGRFFSLGKRASDYRALCGRISSEFWRSADLSNQRLQRYDEEEVKVS
jgi:hypothetical protein